MGAGTPAIAIAGAKAQPTMMAANVATNATSREMRARGERRVRGDAGAATDCVDKFSPQRCDATPPW